MSGPSVPGSRSPRILIVRLSAIGDVIHGMPILNALRDRFPQAMLAWVVEELAAELLGGHPALDELVALPKGWLKSPGIVLGLRRRLRALRPEIAIDVQGLTKSAVAARLSGAPRRIGFGSEWGRELSKWLNTELVRTTAPHTVDRGLQLLGPLGIRSPPVRFDVPESASDRAAAEAMIHGAGCQHGFCVVHPGAAWPSKRWLPARYAAVACHLGRTWGLPTMVVWAGDQARRWAEALVAGSQGHARLAEPMRLTELAALSRRARLYVGSDSGPLHLAAAVGTPCVGLYGPWPAERHGPYGPQHVVVQKMCFEGSTRQRRNASGKFMEAIDVESVSAACDQILSRDASHTAA